ncbi:MAG: zinc ribbon domain-containing protein [Acutalibacteraceae bacterium]
MKSVKPGRGPSMMGGIMSIAVGLFGVFWTILAIIEGAGIMAPFGIIFVVVAVVQAVYNFKNATSKNRHSQFDITDENEEPDPWNERFSEKSSSSDYYGADSSSKSNYCPYCGERADSDFAFCKNCGRKLP